MKVIAQTTGNFGLMDFHGKASNDLEANRPGVIEKTSFYAQRVGLEQVKILCEDVPADFTDTQLAAALAKGQTIEQVIASLKKKPVKE